MQAVRDPALQLVACRVRPGGNLAGAARESPDADPQGFLGGGPRSWTHPSCTEHPATNKHSVREACENDLFGRRNLGRWQSEARRSSFRCATRLDPPLFALQGEAVPGNAFDWAAAAVRDSGSRLSGSRGLAAPRSPASSASSSSSQRPAPCGSPGRAMGQGARPAGCGAPAETPWRPKRRCREDAPADPGRLESYTLRDLRGQASNCTPQRRALDNCARTPMSPPTREPSDGTAVPVSAKKPRRGSRPDKRAVHDVSRFNELSGPGNAAASRLLPMMLKDTLALGTLACSCCAHGRFRASLFNHLSGPLSASA